MKDSDLEETMPKVYCFGYIYFTPIKHLRELHLKEKDVLGFMVSGLSPWSLGSILSWFIIKQNIRTKKE